MNHGGVREQQQLEELRDALDALGNPPVWSDWAKIKAWASEARPFIQKSFPDHVAQFDALVAEPRWVQITHHYQAPDDDGARRAGQRVEERENARFVGLKKGWILAFLDDLAQQSEMDDRSTNANQSPGEE